MTPESELYDIGCAYYQTCRLKRAMEIRANVRGNRTDEFCSALGMMERVCDYLWDNIRSHVVYHAMDGDAILDRAYTAVRGY